MHQRLSHWRAQTCAGRRGVPSIVEVRMPHYHSLIETLLTLLFPDRCVGCQHIGALFCTSCRARLVPYPDTQSEAFEGITYVHIAFVYQSPLREAIHQLKYDRVRRVARPLGALLAT